MIINSGLYSVLVILHLVYAVGPLGFIILHFSAHIVKVSDSCLLITSFLLQRRPRA